MNKDKCLGGIKSCKSVGKEKQINLCLLTIKSMQFLLLKEVGTG